MIKLFFRFASVAPILFAMVGCSSSEMAPPASLPDASSDVGAHQDVASSDSQTTPCDGLDARKPQACLRGGPCSCSDIGSENRGPICVDGGWQCPEGYTRFEDCRGVPPGPSCRDGGPDADAQPTPDARPDQGDALSDAQSTPCDTTDARRPQACVPGGPCYCSDILDQWLPPTCVDGGWQCPEGYTRFEDCRGIPPGPACRDAASGP
jgi:hypothetical protein